MSITTAIDMIDNQKFYTVLPAAQAFTSILSNNLNADSPPSNPGRIPDYLLLCRGSWFVLGVGVPNPARLPPAFLAVARPAVHAGLLLGELNPQAELPAGPALPPSACFIFHVIMYNIMTDSMRWIIDQILALLQSRCDHPPRMVAVDILEGGGETFGVSVVYCRRCGAYKLPPPWRDEVTTEWHRPDPNLWRGR